MSNAKKTNAYENLTEEQIRVGRDFASSHRSPQFARRGVNKSPVRTQVGERAYSLAEQFRRDHDRSVLDDLRKLFRENESDEAIRVSFADALAVALAATEVEEEVSRLCRELSMVLGLQTPGSTQEQAAMTTSAEEHTSVEVRATKLRKDKDAMLREGKGDAEATCESSVPGTPHPMADSSWDKNPIGTDELSSDQLEALAELRRKGKVRLSDNIVVIDSMNEEAAMARFRPLGAFKAVPVNGRNGCLLLAKSRRSAGRIRALLAATK